MSASAIDNAPRDAALKAQVRALEAKCRRLQFAAKRRSHAVGPRPWGEPEPEARRSDPWWAVRRMGPDGSAFHGPMFRHASIELAEREAQFLAEQLPGAVFVVLAAVKVVVVGEPEISA
jgi:hypothetical protein